MPLKIEIKFDGGLETYRRGIDKSLKAIGNLKPLFESFIKYFEGKSGFGKSPILKIYESQGGAIGSSWTNTKEYENWKSKNWQKKRAYPIPINGKSEQILTGASLAALLNPGTYGDTVSVREVGSMGFVYGLDNSYTHVWQKKRRVLDFSPEMFRPLDRLIVEHLNKKAGETEWHN